MFTSTVSSRLLSLPEQSLGDSKESKLKEAQLVESVNELGLKFINQGAGTASLEHPFIQQVMSLEKLPVQLSAGEEAAKSLEELFNRFPGFDLSKFEEGSLALFYRWINSFAIDVSSLVLNDIFIQRSYTILNEILSSSSIEDLQKKRDLKQFIEINFKFQIAAASLCGSREYSSISEEAKQYLEKYVKEFSAWIIDFTGNIEKNIRTSTALVSRSDSIRGKMLNKLFLSKIEEFKKLQNFYLACLQPRYLDKVLNDTPVGFYMGYRRPDPCNVENIKMKLSHFMDYTRIIERKIETFNQKLPVIKKLSVIVKIFQARLENLKGESIFLNQEKGLAEQRIYLKKMFRDLNEHITSLSLKDPMLLCAEDSFQASCIVEIQCFITSAIKIIESTLDFSAQLDKQKSLAYRILLVTNSLYQNIHSSLVKAQKEDFEELSTSSSSCDLSLISSFYSVFVDSDFIPIVNKLAKLSSIANYTVNPDAFDVLFEKLIKCILPILELYFQNVSEAFEKGTLKNFDDLVQIIGSLCSLFILKHDIEILLAPENHLPKSIEEILEPIGFFIDLDEGVSSDEEELEATKLFNGGEVRSHSYEDVSLDRDCPSVSVSTSETFKERTNAKTEMSSKVSLEAKANHKLEASSLETLDVQTAASRVIPKKIDEKKIQGILSDKEIELSRKEKRKKHIELGVARKQKGRKFLQAVSELCGVEIRFANRKANGSHKTIEVGAEEKSQLLTFAAHNGSQQLKTGTSSSILKAVKAFSDQFEEK
jgi:hypothetical protein